MSLEESEPEEPAPKRHCSTTMAAAIAVEKLVVLADKPQLFSFEECTELVRRITRRVSINSKTNNGRSALSVASDLRMVSFLINECGATDGISSVVNLVCKFGSGNETTVNQLISKQLELGVNINESTSEHTALTAALSRHAFSIVAHLLANAADPSLCVQGKSPMQIAMELAYPSALYYSMSSRGVSLLVAHGAAAHGGPSGLIALLRETLSKKLPVQDLQDEPHAVHAILEAADFNIALAPTVMADLAKYASGQLATLSRDRSYSNYSIRVCQWLQRALDIVIAKGADATIPCSEHGLTATHYVVMCGCVFNTCLLPSPYERSAKEAGEVYKRLLKTVLLLSPDLDRLSDPRALPEWLRPSSSRYGSRPSFLVEVNALLDQLEEERVALLQPILPLPHALTSIVAEYASGCPADITKCMEC